MHTYHKTTIMKRLLILFSTMLFAVNCVDAQVHQFKESIYFKLGKTKLTKAHKLKLDSIYELATISKSYNIDITGHTCTIGSLSVNRLVSKTRALSVYNYLIDKGLHKENMTYLGMDYQLPEGNNNTASGRAKNRRTDLDILLNISDIIVSDNDASITTHNASDYLASDADTDKVTSNEDVLPKRMQGETNNFGPEFIEGQLPVGNNKLIKAPNGIEIEIDKNSLVTSGASPIDFEFTDITRNSEVLRRGVKTKSFGNEMKLLGAFGVEMTQDYNDVAINVNEPMVVYIPGEYDPDIKLYSNHRNWTLDTINSMSYDEEKESYAVQVKNASQLIGLLKPITKEDTMVYLAVRIKGLDRKYIKPYVIYDDCTISKGYYHKSSYFIFPITKLSEKYRLRAAYTDYSSRDPQPYSLNFDVMNLSPVGKVKKREYKDIIYLRDPSKIEMKKEKLPVSGLCEQAE